MMICLSEEEDVSQHPPIANVIPAEAEGNGHNEVNSATT